jgi:putative SOS response-associated peptidase YedK
MMPYCLRPEAEVGILPYLSTDLHTRRPINARVDIIQTSGMFKSAFAKRRRLVPADAFYEWKAVADVKQPTPSRARTVSQWHLRDCGAVSDGAVERTFTIITTNANAIVGELHDRMPEILEPRDWPKMGCRDQLSPTLVRGAYSAQPNRSLCSKLRQPLVV